MFGFFKKKRSWVNFDKYFDRETSSGVKLTESGVIGIPAVFACVRVLAESISSLPLIVFERDEQGDKHRARNFSLYSILHDIPNPLMTSFELREMLIGHLALRGNAFCYIERDQGEIVALWPLHPGRMTAELKGRNLIYIYQSDGPEIKYSADDILHIRGLSSDGVVGFSPLSVFRDTFGAAKAVTDFSANYFKNDASPGGILSTPHDLGSEQAVQLRESWEAGFRGSGKKHRVAILGGDLTWQAVSISPQDSQMIESQKFSVVQIARIYRVPLNLIMDYDRSTYSNVTEQNRSFLTHTLAPWLTRIEKAMFKALLTEEEKKRFYIEHLTQDFLRADTKARYEAYEIGKRAGFLSTNEIRGFENMNKVEGGDVHEAKQPEPQKKSIRKMAGGIENRDRVAEYFKPLIQDAAVQVINRETIQVKRAVKKFDQGREITSFRDWLENFYSEIIPGFIEKKMGPVLRSYALAIQKESEAETGAAKADLRAFIEKHISHYTNSHVNSSLGQLMKLLEEKGTEAIEQRVDEWAENEKRAEQIADRQRVSTSGLIFSEVAFLAGFKIMSNTRGDSCPWCKQLNGKIVGRGENMLDPGDWKGLDGQTMRVRRPHIAPSYHRGCDCYLTHVG